MLDREIAALSHFIRQFVRKHYFGEVPEDIVFPSVFFPVPEVHGNGHSLNTYENTFSLYIKIFHQDDFQSYSAASEIMNGIQRAGKRIPLYDEDGKLTGRNFPIKSVETKKIDDGVTQMAITWNTYEAYGRVESNKAIGLYFEGLATSKVKEEDDG